MKGAASEWVCGVHAVGAALARARVRELWVLQNAPAQQRLAELAAAAAAAGVPVRRVDKQTLEQRVPGSNHQGVAAAVTPAEILHESDLEQLLTDLSTPPFLLILDGVQDPHNLGACLRSADAAGAQGVVVPKDKAVGLTPTVRKVACGAAETVPLFQVTNLARTLRTVQQAGVWLVGLAGEAEASLYDIDLKGPLGLVLGAEGQGLRRLTREHCDRLARIPLCGTVESLNVSVAAGVSLFEAARQRR